MIFKLGLIIADVLVLAITDNKIAKICAVLSVILLSISLLGGGR